MIPQFTFTPTQYRLPPFAEPTKSKMKNYEIAEHLLKGCLWNFRWPAQQDYIRNCLNNTEFRNNPMVYVANMIISKQNKSWKHIEDPIRQFLIANLQGFSVELRSPDFLEKVAEKRFANHPDKIEIIRNFKALVYDPYFLNNLDKTLYYLREKIIYNHMCYQEENDLQDLLNIYDLAEEKISVHEITETTYEGPLVFDFFDDPNEIEEYEKPRTLMPDDGVVWEQSIFSTGFEP